MIKPDRGKGWNGISKVKKGIKVSKCERRPNKLSNDLSCGQDKVVKLHVCTLRMFGIWVCLQALGRELKETSQNPAPTTHLHPPPTHKQRWYLCQALYDFGQLCRHQSTCNSY